MPRSPAARPRSEPEDPPATNQQGQASPKIGASSSTPLAHEIASKLLVPRIQRVRAHQGFCCSLPCASSQTLHQSCICMNAMHVAQDERLCYPALSLRAQLPTRRQQARSAFGTKSVSAPRAIFRPLQPAGLAFVHHGALSCAHRCWPYRTPCEQSNRPGVWLSADVALHQIRSSVVSLSRL